MKVLKYFRRKTKSFVENCMTILCKTQKQNSFRRFQSLFAKNVTVKSGKIFVGCGSKERPDGIKKSTDEMKSAGYNVTGYISEGTAHEFLTWRRSLHLMAQELFK